MKVKKIETGERVKMMTHYAFWREIFNVFPLISKQEVIFSTVYGEELMCVRLFVGLSFYLRKINCLQYS